MIEACVAAKNRLFVFTRTHLSDRTWTSVRSQVNHVSESVSSAKSVDSSSKPKIHRLRRFHRKIPAETAMFFAYNCFTQVPDSFRDCTEQCHQLTANLILAARPASF